MKSWTNSLTSYLNQRWSFHEVLKFLLRVALLVGLIRGRVMTKDEFVEEVFELAFGDNAINRDFRYAEVLMQLRDFSDDALLLERVIETVNEGI